MRTLQDAPAPVIRRFQTSDGLELAADLGGDPAAPTVILLHGGGQTRHAWSGAMKRLLAEGYHVVNFDSRGHGDSDWSPDADYSAERRGRDLLDVLAHVRGPAALVGASMGGLTSIEALAQDPAAPVRALVLVDIVPRPAVEGTDKILAFMRANREGFGSLDEASDAVAAYNTHRRRPSDSSGLLKNLRRRDGRYYWHWDPRMLDTMPTSGEAVDGAGFLEKCRQIRIPTLLVRGMMSDIVDDRGVEELRAVIPQLEVFKVSDAGHMVAGDRNDAFNDGVIAFLRRRLPVG